MPFSTLKKVQTKAAEY